MKQPSMRLPALLTVIAFVANLAVVGVVWLDNQADGSRRDDTIERLDKLFADFQSSRTQSRQTACNDANGSRIAHNRLVLEIAGFDPQTGEPTERWTAQPPERQAELLPRVTRNLVPLRFCTDEAIEAFYASNGADGVFAVDAADGYAEAVVPP